jgi:hypothetical protein
VLNYWAFVDYLDESTGMSIGLNRYLVAKDKKGIRYCLVEEGVRLDKMSTKAWSISGMGNTPTPGAPAIVVLMG